MSQNIKYSDKPNLNQHSFIAIFHLAFWILFHPSAWLHYLSFLNKDNPTHTQFRFHNLPRDPEKKINGRLFYRKNWQDPYLSQLLKIVLLIFPTYVFLFNIIASFSVYAQIETASINIPNIFLISFIIAVGCVIQIPLIGAAPKHGDIATIVGQLWGAPLFLVALILIILQQTTIGSLLLFFTFSTTLLQIAKIDKSLITKEYRKISESFFIALLILTTLILSEIFFIPQMGSLQIKGNMIVWHITNPIAVTTFLTILLTIITYFTQSKQTTIVVNNVIFFIIMNLLIRFYPTVSSILTLLFLACFIAAATYVSIERLTYNSFIAAICSIIALVYHPFILMINQPNHQPTIFFQLLFIFSGSILIGYFPDLILYPFAYLYGSALRANAENIPSNNPAHLLHRHPAFWHETTQYPYTNIIEYILLVHNKEPEEAEKAIDYLRNKSIYNDITRHISLTLLQTKMLAIDNIESLATLYQSIPITTEQEDDSAGSWLTQAHIISQDIFSARQQHSTINQRIKLKKIKNYLTSLDNGLQLSTNQYFPQLSHILKSWRTLIETELFKLAQTNQIPNPYNFSTPIDGDLESGYIKRIFLASKLEDLLTHQLRPPILLYGQSRTGKTTLIKNLTNLLSQDIIVCYIDGQSLHPTNNSELIEQIMINIHRSIPQNGRYQLPPFTPKDHNEHIFWQFQEALKLLHLQLEKNNQTGLIILDEVEILYQIFDQQAEINSTLFLNTLRHIIQHYKRIKLILSASRTIEELTHWAPHLVNLHTLKIGFFSKNETVDLIEKPYPDFPLIYQPDAIDKIWSLTGGHPHLIQLICHQIVDLINNRAQENNQVDLIVRLADVEKIATYALQENAFFPIRIAYNELPHQTHQLLSFLAHATEQSPISFDSIIEQFPNQPISELMYPLINRDIVKKEGDYYSFYSELLRIWFAQGNL